MAKIETEGEFPRRIGDLVLYPWGNKVVIKVKSGFTTEALKTAPQYAKSRQNASEFGRVSSLCKQMRLALYGILPKQNNLTVVNTLTKKMREVMTCDIINTRGERQLAAALTTEEGRQMLKDYQFNPETLIAVGYEFSDNNLNLKTKGVAFPKGANCIGFRMHHLAFDFATGANALVSGDWVMESKSTLRKTTTMTLPTKPDASGLVFTLLEIQFYNYTEGSYVPMVEDRSKSVVIVEVI